MLWFNFDALWLIKRLAIEIERCIYADDDNILQSYEFEISAHTFPRN